MAFIGVVILAAACVGGLAVADQLAIKLGCTPNLIFWIGFVGIAICALA